jgi:hypothetical protein
VKTRAKRGNPEAKKYSIKRIYSYPQIIASGKLLLTILFNSLTSLGSEAKCVIALAIRLALSLTLTLLTTVLKDSVVATIASMID